MSYTFWVAFAAAAVFALARLFTVWPELCGFVVFRILFSRPVVVVARRGAGSTDNDVTTCCSRVIITLRPPSLPPRPPPQPLPCHCVLCRIHRIIGLGRIAVGSIYRVSLAFADDYDNNRRIIIYIYIYPCVSYFPATDAVRNDRQLLGIIV